MTQQYMAGYPPVQAAPGYVGGPPPGSGSYGGHQDMYNYPPPPPGRDQAAYAGPPGRLGSYSQPGFDPYVQQQPAGQLAPYNPAAQYPPSAPMAPDGSLIPPAVAPDGTLIPPPMAADGTLMPITRPRMNSSSSSRSHHSSRSHKSTKSSRSARLRREAEIEKRPSWADSVLAMWDAFKGALDSRRV